MPSLILNPAIAFFALVLALVRRIRFSRRIRSQRGEVAVTGGRLS